MAGFDKVYNDQCTKLWNPDPSTPLQFEVRSHGWGYGYYVVAKRDGLGIQQGNTFKDKAQAQAYCDKLREEYENE